MSTAAEATPTALRLGPIPHARVVVLVSGTGSLLQSILDYCRSGADVGFELVGVVADRDCSGIDRAATAGLPTAVISPGDYPDREHWNEALTTAVAEFRPDLVVSAGFMRILGAAFLAAFGGRLINTHPALLPSFPGAHAVEDALAYGVRITGTTVHLIDAGVDTGPIIAQAPVPVELDDDRDSLHERIKTVERSLLCDIITTITQSGVVIPGTWSTEN